MHWPSSCYATGRPRRTRWSRFHMAKSQSRRLSLPTELLYPVGRHSLKLLHIAAALPQYLGGDQVVARCIGTSLRQSGGAQPIARHTPLQAIPGHILRPRCLFDNSLVRRRQGRRTSIGSNRGPGLLVHKMSQFQVDHRLMCSGCFTKRLRTSFIEFFDTHCPQNELVPRREDKEPYIACPRIVSLSGMKPTWTTPIVRKTHTSPTLTAAPVRHARRIPEPAAGHRRINQ